MVFFDETFIAKLIYSMKEQNNFSNLFHLEELKIPFSEDDSKIEDKNYLDYHFQKIQKKLQGKLILTNFHVDFSTTEQVNIFVKNPYNDFSISNNSFNNSIPLNTKNNYVGISFKKYDNDKKYAIYFLYATDI